MSSFLTGFFKNSPSQNSPNKNGILLPIWYNPTPIWIGREEELKQIILKLSHNPLTFRLDDLVINNNSLQNNTLQSTLQSSLQNNNIEEYNYNNYIEQINILTKYDENLNIMLDLLVPKYIDDITFWKSYFFCIHKILYCNNLNEIEDELCELYNYRRKFILEREELIKIEMNLIYEKLNLLKVIFEKYNLLEVIVNDNLYFIKLNDEDIISNEDIMIIEENMYECIDKKKKISLLTSEINVVNNNELIEKISEMNHLFMSLHSKYIKYKEKLNLNVNMVELNYDSKILNKFNLKYLNYILPNRFKLNHQLKLIYSNSEHGTSLKTLIRNCSDVSPTILLIKTTKNDILGVYQPCNLQLNNKYYGTGEIVLFHYTNDLFVFYKWSKLNDYFIRTNENYLCYGGDIFGRCALKIDDNLRMGQTNECLTFLNHYLINTEKENSTSTTSGNTSSIEMINTKIDREQSSDPLDFEIYAIEVWGFEEHCGWYGCWFSCFCWFCWLLFDFC
ncbi:hypothetical protein ABK040_004582 [Willaertia magna]